MSQQQQHPQTGNAGGHPRRPPAHRSVSLLHSPGKRKLDQEVSEVSISRNSSTLPSSDRANPPSPDSSKPEVKKDSSGEVSDAGQWFENSNKNISQNSVSFIDNEPPFFLRNSSSSTSPDQRNPTLAHIQQRTSIPHRPALMRLGTEGSSVEDFRSVIDDLTIENKKLKKRLKKYEKMHDAHLQDERLFEIRVHGLPPHKKKELEETLRKFAMDLEERSPDVRAARSYDPPNLRAQNTTSSHASHFADSAYHSISLSGQNSNTASGQNSNAASGQNSNTTSGDQESRSKKMSKSQFNRQQDSIQSYLQDIPQGLLPKPVAMTDTSKKKLVVKRLEQIFAGKGPAPGGHHQPIQQQEVAQSAAHADRMELEKATGQQARQEGHREARIMHGAGEDLPQQKPLDGDVDTTHQLNPEAMVEEQDFAPRESPGEKSPGEKSPGDESPDQRPTRPLDLDPQRAQIPQDNMNYIRHLGFSPPDVERGEPQEDGHGWIYLNLLMNMAQLHTINVTTEFVKKALQEYSSKFELSRDGRKIRWKGGKDTSLNNSDSSPEQELDISKAGVKKMGKKRQKLARSSAENSSEATGQSSDRTALRSKRGNELAYTPLFYHKESSDGYGSNVDGSDDLTSPLPAQGTGNSSGLASSGNRTSSSKKRREEGPIIFYNKARFCTDLSGDRGVQNGRNCPDYSSYTPVPLGATVHKGYHGGELEGDARHRPLTQASNLPSDMDVDQPSSSDIELEFPGISASTNKKKVSEEVNFDASGLGGIIPYDNFTVDVECRHVQVHAPESAYGAIHAGSKLCRNRISELLDDDGTPRSITSKGSRPIIDREILSTNHRSLPPSELPPPSLLPFDSSSGDMDSDLESYVSDMDIDDVQTTSEPLNAMPRMMNLDSASQETDSGGSERDEEEGESETNDSLDFLALAREIDPDNVRVQEREFAANMAERLAEEIPAGSSAATAGGGSGYNSPASPSILGEADNNEAEQRSGSGGSAAASKGPSLKRARTSDSMVVHGKASRHE